jgi:hypothetical protein
MARFKRSHIPGSNPESVVLHRKDIVNKRLRFSFLRDPIAERKFNSELLLLLTNLNYGAITVTIDKREHLERYRVWHKNPYHYCMEAMIERYSMHLNGIGAVGDIMVEARDKKLDKKLKDNYQFFYRNGTSHLGDEDIKRALSSRELKLERKAANVSGLQLADLFAHPASVAHRRRQSGHRVPDNFGGKVATVLAGKYRRSYGGRVDGYGRKWLP